MLGDAASTTASINDQKTMFLGRWVVGHADEDFHCRKNEIFH